MNILRDEDFYYQYEQNGGTVEMPKEVFWELYNDSKEEIERLKDLVIALWHNDNARLLNKEQIDLLNNIVFGNDGEDYIGFIEHLENELKGVDKE